MDNTDFGGDNLRDLGGDNLRDFGGDNPLDFEGYNPQGSEEDIPESVELDNLDFAEDRGVARGIHHRHPTDMGDLWDIRPRTDRPDETTEAGDTCYRRRRHRQHRSSLQDACANYLCKNRRTPNGSGSR